MEHAVRQMLPTHSNDITAPLRCVEQKGQRQSCARANWMRVFEGCNIVLGPSAETSRFRFLAFGTRRRIGGNDSRRDTVPHKCADGFEKLIRRCWRASLRRQHSLDMNAL